MHNPGTLLAKYLACELHVLYVRPPPRPGKPANLIFEEIMTKQYGISACTLVSLVALALPCVAQQNPWNGFWKEDLSTFKYDGPTFSIATDTDGFTITRSGTPAVKIVCDGTPKAHPNGSATTCNKSAAGYELVNTRDGKQTSKETIGISPDGKKITRTSDFKSPGGAPNFATATSKRISGGPGLSGTWKETAVHESWNTGVLGIQINGDSVEFKETDDKPITCKLGSPTTILGTQMITMTQDDPLTLKATYSNNGKVTRVNTFVLSSDGKTVTETDITPAPWVSTLSVMFHRS